MAETPNQQYRSRVRVYVEDTDAGGIVYYANYLKFMERARTEWLRAAGVEQSNTFQSDLSFVVYAINVRFLRPARLDDELEVSASIVEVRAASMVFEQSVINLGNGEECCNAQVSVACVSLSRQRPRRIPREILEAFKKRISGTDQPE